MRHQARLCCRSADSNEIAPIAGRHPTDKARALRNAGKVGRRHGWQVLPTSCRQPGSPLRANPRRFGAVSTMNRDLQEPSHTSLYDRHCRRLRWSVIVHINGCGALIQKSTKCDLLDFSACCRRHFSRPTSPFFSTLYFSHRVHYLVIRGSLQCGLRPSPEPFLRRLSALATLRGDIISYGSQ